MSSLFTRIIVGELPGHFVWKDAEATAFLTIQPIREGHLLVVPRAEVDHWDDLPEPLAAHLMVVAQRIARALKTLYRPQRVGLVIAGLEVPHTHLHVIPIDGMGDLSFARARHASNEQLGKTAADIRAALREAGWPEASE
jgi:diadenosine tetraphosphate (Ap4A) HIT family hydrolase